MVGHLLGLAAAFVPAFGLGWMILRFRSHHERYTADSGGGPQKIHSIPVPRIGGLMIFAGLAAGVLTAVWKGYLGLVPALCFLASCLPAFCCGLYEDLTKDGGVAVRLLATFMSAGLAFVLLDARIDRLELGSLDGWLAFWPLSFAVTLFMAAGVSQSLNIIDGLNGLAGFVAMTALCAMGFVAWRLGDELVLVVALASVGGLLGFLMWNFPRGRIFCGDGGAYLLGFVLAVVSVLLVHRNPQVSAWFPLVVAAYPVWETLFSIYRRRVVSGKSAMRPDALHLHSLVYRRANRSGTGKAWLRNAQSSAVCWIMPLLAALLAVSFWDQTWKLVCASAGFAAFYVLVYQALANPRNWRGARRIRTPPPAAVEMQEIRPL